MQKAANGSGGIFKTAAAEILRAERRLMSTGESICPQYPALLPGKLSAMQPMRQLLCHLTRVITESV